MTGWQNPLLTGQRCEVSLPEVPDGASADQSLHKTTPAEQPKELQQEKPSILLDPGGDLNEPVVPIAELRLLAKTRERSPSTDIRTRISLFVAALLVIGIGIVGGRYFYPATALGVQSADAALPEEPVQLPAQQAVEVEQPRTDISSSNVAELAPASTAAADSSAELSNQRLEIVVRDLAAIQASVQRLAAQQEEIIRSIAELHKEKKVGPSPVHQPSQRATAKPANPQTNTLPLPPAKPPGLTEVQQPSTSTPPRDSRAQIPRPPLSIRGD